LPELITMAIEQGSASQASPVSPREALEKISAFIEQLQFSKLEMRGLGFNTPPDRLLLRAFRVDRIDKGTLSDLTFEGFDFYSSRESFKAGALVLKGLNLTGMLRKAADWSALPRPPMGLEALEMLKFLQGFEMRDFLPPKEGAGMAPAVEVKLFQASWGQFVGVVPTKLRFTARATMPTDANEPAFLKDLAKLGLRSLTLSYDLGSDWSGLTRMLEVKPIALEIEKLFAFSAAWTLANVPSEIFELDPARFDPDRFEALTGKVEAGRIELSFRDDGAVTLGIAEFARNQGVTPADAQKMLIDEMNKDLRTKLRSSPEALSIINAIQRLLEQPGSTLTIALTPKRQVTVNQIVEQFGIDPNMVLSNFNVEANVHR
jgi:hypothetical protein